MNRRNLLTAAAWGAPVIAFSAAAPAYASSQPTKPHACDKIKGSREDCGKDYEYTVRITCSLPVARVMINGITARKTKTGWMAVSRKKFSAAPVIITHTGASKPTTAAVTFN